MPSRWAKLCFRLPGALDEPYESIRVGDVVSGELAIVLARESVRGASSGSPMSTGDACCSPWSRDQAQNAVNTLSNQSLMGRLVYVREVCVRRIHGVAIYKY